MSNPDPTQQPCNRSPICNDEKCHCEEFHQSLKDMNDFHVKQMNLINSLIKQNEV